LTRDKRKRNLNNLTGREKWHGDRKGKGEVSFEYKKTG